MSLLDFLQIKRRILRKKKLNSNFNLWIPMKKVRIQTNVYSLYHSLWWTWHNKVTTHIQRPLFIWWNIQSIRTLQRQTHWFLSLSSNHILEHRGDGPSLTRREQRVPLHPDPEGSHRRSLSNSPLPTWCWSPEAVRLLALFDDLMHTLLSLLSLGAANLGQDVDWIPLATPRWARQRVGGRRLTQATRGASTKCSEVRNTELVVTKSWWSVCWTWSQNQEGRNLGFCWMSNSKIFIFARCFEQMNSFTDVTQLLFVKTQQWETLVLNQSHKINRALNVY